MHSTSGVRRACAVGTTIALIGLTTGIGVFGASAAFADDAAQPTTTTPTTTVAAGSSDGTPADAGAADPTPTGTPTPTGGATSTTTDPTPTDAATPTDAPSASATAPSRAPRSPFGGLALHGLPTTTRVAAAPQAAAQTVEIKGTPKLGGSVYAKNPTGFTNPASLVYTWSVNGVADAVHDPTFHIDDDSDVGQTITLTVTSDVPGEVATAQVGPVTEDPVFVDADGAPVTAGTKDADHPLVLTATAGDPYSYTFHAKASPAATYAVTWSDPDQADPDDPTYTPDSQLPDGFTFDETTGVLSGTSDWATDYEFAITATSSTATTGTGTGTGTVATATQYVEVDVDAAAPLGVQVFSADKADLKAFLDGLSSDATSGTLKSWIIDTDGTVSTDVTQITSDDDGVVVEQTTTPGGTPTVPQGGTLVVSGGLVDRFGNQVSTADGDTYPFTVTSDTTSDVIAEDSDFGDGVVDVTFPHASTHRLTVSSEGFTTAFAVAVTPTVVVPTVSTGTGTAVSAPVASTTGARRLAYTGSDTAAVLPWALGLLVAGAGVTGLRIARRRARR